METIWTLAAMSVLLVVGLMLIAHKIRTDAARRADAAPRYERIDKLMSEAERSFFGVLNQIAGSEFHVFAKVRIADVLAPSPGLDRSALNRISLRHFDFVVCAATDLRILCAVELDDRSHQRRERVEHDAFVDRACATSGLPLVRVPAAAQYSATALSEQIGAAIKRAGG